MDAEMMASRWLPRAPLAAAQKAGPYVRMSRENALSLAYIEANPMCMQSLMVIDHDGGMADELPGLLDLPSPSWTALNPATRSGHIVYALTAPVCLTDAANRRPVNLLARVESGLCAVLGGDHAYAGRITKNPTNNAHLPLWGPDTAVYGLREIARSLSDLGALPRYDDHKAIQISGVGRNVALFDQTRRWAYRRRGDYRDQTEWEQVVEAYAWDRNLVTIGDNFSRGPLERPEVRHIARSVSRWTWRNITRTFNEEQQARSARAHSKRWGDYQARRASIREAATR